MRYLSVFSSDEEILKALADNKIQANTVACNKIQENE